MLVRSDEEDDPLHYLLVIGIQITTSLCLDIPDCGRYKFLGILDKT